MSHDRIHVGKVSRMCDLVLAVSCSFRGITARYIQKIRYAFNVKKPNINLGGQSKYCLVSSGHAHIYLREIEPVNEKEKIWVRIARFKYRIFITSDINLIFKDHASGVILVEEAGGVTSDLDGKPLDFSVGISLDNNRGVIACSSVYILTKSCKVLSR